MRCRNLRIRRQEHQIPRTHNQLRRPQGSLRVSCCGEVHQQTQQLHREGQTTRRTQPGEVAGRSLAQTRLQRGRTVPHQEHVSRNDALPRQVQPRRRETTTLRHSLLTPDMRIIPFCSFNVIPEWYRDRIQKKYGVSVEEWEKKNGEKLESRLYRGQ